MASVAVLAMAHSDSMAQFFDPQQPYEQTRTMKRDRYQWAMALKECPDASMSGNNCQGATTSSPKQIWIEAGPDKYTTHHTKKPTSSEITDGIPDSKVFKWSESFTSRGFAFYTTSAVVVPTPNSAIMSYACPGGSTPTTKSVTPTGSAELVAGVPGGPVDSWTSPEYASTSAAVPPRPTVKYTGSSHDGGISGTVGCIANWIGNGWTWQGSYQVSGAMDKITINVTLPPVVVNYEHQGIAGAHVDKAPAVSVQWNFVVVTRMATDTLGQMKLSNEPETAWRTDPKVNGGAWKLGTMPTLWK